MSSVIQPEFVQQNPEEVSSFDVASYLQERIEKDSFIMVEFGHDALPVAYQQSRPFTGDRAYIGYEAWLRDLEGKKQKSVQELHEQHDGHALNVHYQTLALGGIVRTAYDYGKAERWFEGDYNPATSLPDNTVEEVFISNVFGDPYVSNLRERTNALVSESARIVANDGYIIIRETITPARTASHLENSITAHNLNISARITEDDDTWESLESQFGYGQPHNKDSFYLFLQKKNDIVA